MLNLIKMFITLLLWWFGIGFFCYLCILAIDKFWNNSMSLKNKSTQETYYVFSFFFTILIGPFAIYLIIWLWKKRDK